MNLESLRRWGTESVCTVREERLSGLDSVWRPAYYKFLHQVERFQDPGTSIYEIDWDVLVVLDACRYDLMAKVTDDYEFLTTVGNRRSVDSMTPVWMRRTFVEAYIKEMAETYYLCVNSFSAEILDEEDFTELNEIWRYAWKDDLETVTPKTLTNHSDALGEWEIYDHFAGCLHPVVKNVPWVETTATDEETYDPRTERKSITEADVKERLRDMGYV